MWKVNSHVVRRRTASVDAISPLAVSEADHQQRRTSLQYVILIFVSVLILTCAFYWSSDQLSNGVLDDSDLQEYQKTFSDAHQKSNNAHNLDVEKDGEWLDEDGEISKKNDTSQRSFQYIGHIDSTKPQPWPKEEKDWWDLHNKLTKRVSQSDSLPIPRIHTDSNDTSTSSYLPQLIFYGDSITEGWNGTSMGNIPGPSRMWSHDEPSKIRQIFENNFGARSLWGKTTLRPPLILGISGSRTYDFLWRIMNGEFPTSQLLSAKHIDGKSSSIDGETFQLELLDRIYVVLIGTNNLGGGMSPDATIQGIDAVGKNLLQLIRYSAPKDTPAAIVLSEILPRKDDYRAVRMCPPKCKNLASLEPYSSFLPAIEKVNKALPGVLNGWKHEFPNSRLVLLSYQHDSDKNEIDGAQNERTAFRTVWCGEECFSLRNESEFFDHMPDGLHPNAKGYNVWSRCIKNGLEAIMSETNR